MPEKLNSSILNTLAYFDLFQYPLSQEEIHSFLGQRTSPEVLAEELDRLTFGRLLFRRGPWYSLRDGEVPHEKRIASNRCALPLVDRARRNARFLYCFPFVRGIGISGSLSKNCADSTSDIDYFIITRKDRLWICRTLMHLFKKLTFLTGHQRFFCMNYYVDESAFQIEEKNIFTATELVTLIPVLGSQTMGDFFSANQWVNAYFPNYPHKHGRQGAETGKLRLKSMIEFLFNNRKGEQLDNYLCRLTTRRWKVKEEEQRLNINGNRMGLKTGKHYSKPNPAYLQEKILSQLREKVAGLQHQLLSMAPNDDSQTFFRREII
jgi:hypothetical protein